MSRMKGKSKEIIQKQDKKDSFLLILGLCSVSLVLVVFIFFPLENVNFGQFSRKQDFKRSFAADLVDSEKGNLNLLAVDTSQQVVQSLPDELKALVQKELSAQPNVSWVAIKRGRDYVINYVIRDPSIVVKINDGSREAEIKGEVGKYLDSLKINEAGLKVHYTVKPKI